MKTPKSFTWKEETKLSQLDSELAVTTEETDWANFGKETEQKVLLSGARVGIWALVFKQKLVPVWENQLHDATKPKKEADKPGIAQSIIYWALR